MKSEKEIEKIKDEKRTQITNEFFDKVESFFEKIHKELDISYPLMGTMMVTYVLTKELVGAKNRKHFDEMAKFWEKGIPEIIEQVKK